MTKLRRTKACGYTLESSCSIDDLRNMPIGEIKAKLQSVESIFKKYRKLSVSQAQAQRFLHGGSLDILRTALRGNEKNGEILRILSPGGEFIGLGKTDTNEGQIKFFKLFAEAGDFAGK